MASGLAFERWHTKSGVDGASGKRGKLRRAYKAPMVGRTDIGGKMIVARVQLTGILTLQES
jgi:hypothetical protein